MRFLALIPLLFGVQVNSILLKRNFPHLIIPVSSQFPDTPLGTRKQFDVQHVNHTEFLCDVPGRGKVPGVNYCKLSFNLNRNPARNAPFVVWGEHPRIFNISALGVPPVINENTDTWNNRPQPGPVVASVVINEDMTTQTASSTFACPEEDSVMQFVAFPGSDRDFGVGWYELDYPEGAHGITLDMFS